MATISGCILSSSPFSFQYNANSKLRLPQFVNRQSVHGTIYDKDKSYQYIHGVPKLRGRLQKHHPVFAAGSGNKPQKHDSISENIFPIGKSSFRLSENGGNPGVVPFRDLSVARDLEVILSDSDRSRNKTLWILGPAILIASFVFPPLFLPEILLNSLGDSPLTIFLLLFFTEAVFYCGVAVFFLLLDSSMRHTQPDHFANKIDTLTPHLGHQISSIATMVLSITIPIATIVMTWQWTSHLVAATLVPYLVGIVVQFTFEQLARYLKSPSWTAISFIFHAYRLHQIHRAANLVTYVSFEASRAEIAYRKLPVPNFGMLSNVLHFLLVICLWSFSSFLTRLLLQPSSDAKMI